MDFTLAHTYSGTGHLTIALAGQSQIADVVVGVNGTSLGRMASFPNDQTIYRSGNQSGHYHLVLMTFPASLLKAGANSVTFQAIKVGSGGGRIYDTIKLEVG